MLSSYHGKTPSKTSQPYYNSDVNNRVNNVDGNVSMAIDGDMLDAMEVSYDRLSLNHPSSSPDKTLPFKGDGFAPASPAKRPSIPASTPAETSALLADGTPSSAIKLDREMSVIASPPTKRLQRNELFITTDAHGVSTTGSSDVSAYINMPNSNHNYNTGLSSSLKHSSSLHNQQQQQQQQCSLLHGSTQNLPFQSPHRHSLPARTAGVSNQLDYGKCNAPPANCSLPTALSRRASLETTMMSPPTSGGMIKSATTSSFYPASANDYSPNSPCYSDLGSPIQHVIQRRRSSLSGVSRSNNTTNSVKQRMVMDAGALDMQAKDRSYLPTPTEPSFRSSVHEDPSPYADFGPSIAHSLPPHMPATPADAFLSSEVHPFDMSNTVAAGTAVDARLLNGSSGISTSTASATIQYLQQLQQAMLSQDDYHALNFALGPQGRQLIERQSAQHKQHQQQQQQQKASQLGQPTQLRRGSKAKLKRRPSMATAQTYPTADKAWTMTAAQTAMAARPNFALTCLNTDHPFSPNNINAQSAPSATTPVPAQQFYHGPAPCGNPEPLYEYLASPTVVPGLEIIGHDYYGNYVQILPICPETTCSMNQDPVYLNLLQAIYAHTIPFLDLAPGSEEETQRLMSSTSSAIATQSIQPPFKNLFPLNHTTTTNNNTPAAAQDRKPLGRAGTPVKQENRTTLSSSASSPSFQQPHSKPSAAASSSTSSSGLPRRSSLGSISSITAVSNNIRRSSTTSNPSSANNPARKKKNTPRTHPYKSTSSFKDDNPTVTEAILTQVGGLGGIGNCVTISATDPRHKITEKMVHMDEAEYTAHYSRHQHAMNKSTSSSTALCLAQTLATSMTGSSLGLPPPPSALMSSSVSAPSITHATVSCNNGNSTGEGVSSLDSIAAAEFIRALSQCNNGGGNGLGLKSHGNGHASSTAAAATVPLTGGSIATTTTISAPLQHRDLVSLENLMLLDSNAAAAVQAAAATSAWPNWFDLHQLERDVCEVGMNNQASAFTSASCSMTHMPLSNSTTLASFANNRSKENSSTNLLLSSSTDLAMMEDLLDDRAQRTDNSNNNSNNNNNNNNSSKNSNPMSSSTNAASSSSSSSSIQRHDSQMMLTVPGATIDNQNSTSQVLVFDNYTAEQLSLSPAERSTTTSSFSSSSISSLSSTSTNTTMTMTTTTATTGVDNNKKDSECPPPCQKEPVTNDLTLPYISSLLTVLPFSVEHSHPIFPTRGNRRSGWYRSKSVASQGLSQITGVDYTTTCWYDVERLQNVVRDSISFQESSALKSLEDLTEPDPTLSK
ncbi:hypothetical protein BGZ67_002230 [Mortierella alpina]|nr:hypothetical protein BGZ67_002230 [Mortierella alpina]